MKTSVLKRIISVILVLVMLPGSLTLAFATAEEYTSGNYTYILSEGKATIVSYPETAKGVVDIPTYLDGYQVSSIGDYSFYACTLITGVVIPDTVTSIGNFAFAYCTTITTIQIPGSVTSIGKNAFKNSNNVVFSCEKGSYAEQYAIENGIETTDEPVIPGGRKKYIGVLDDFVTTVVLSTSEAYVSEITVDGLSYPVKKNILSDAKATKCLYRTVSFIVENYEVISFYSTDIYDLGEETYGFENFSDDDSEGHCFGMSITSSGYHTKNLDPQEIYGSDSFKLNSFSRTAEIQQQICEYQNLQGRFSNYAIVAGGSWYLSEEGLDSDYDIESDWEEIISFVQDHKRDHQGNLQIGFRKKNEGGHAINFLYYKEVDGQPRIYAYDNNFPDIETYFYKNSKGEIFQAPYSTFSGSIDCMALRSVDLYYSNVDLSRTDRFIYGYEDDISISGIKGYPMEQGKTDSEMLMFEIPEGKTDVVITPLKNNAKFSYLGMNYSFGMINVETKGVLTLGESSGTVITEIPKFDVINGGDIDIRVPSLTTINYGDSIILNADIDGTLPVGARIEWTADNGNFNMSVSEDGLTCKISPESSGKTVFTATVYDKDGNIISSDTQEMTSKAGLWQKIVAFFKKVFGLTKTIPEAFKGIF